MQVLQCNCKPKTDYQHKFYHELSVLSVYLISGRASLEFPSKTQTIMPDVFPTFPQCSSAESPSRYLEIGHGIFPSHPFQFIILELSCHSTLYIPICWKSL